MVLSWRPLGVDNDSLSTKLTAGYSVALIPDDLQLAPSVNLFRHCSYKWTLRQYSKRERTLTMSNRSGGGAVGTIDFTGLCYGYDSGILSFETDGIVKSGKQSAMVLTVADETGVGEGFSSPRKNSGDALNIKTASSSMVVIARTPSSFMKFENPHWQAHPSSLSFSWSSPSSSCVKVSAKLKHDAYAKERLPEILHPSPTQANLFGVDAATPDSAICAWYHAHFGLKSVSRRRRKLPTSLTY